MMTPEEELAIINKLIKDEEDNYNNNRQQKSKDKAKKELYQELFQDKVNGILGG